MAVVMSRPILAASEKAPPLQNPEMETELMDAFAALRSHTEGQTKLDAGQIELLKLTIDRGRDIFDCDDAVIKAAFDLVATYDDTIGPLWIAHGAFNRRGKQPANDVHWTIYNFMQNIMDRVYTAENIARYGELLNGFKFGCPHISRVMSIHRRIRNRPIA